MTRTSPTPTSPTSNLVLWGDPTSNAVLKKIADKLPIQWDGDKIVVGDKAYSAADHVPILIFPNPLNPSSTWSSTAASPTASTTT